MLYLDSRDVRALILALREARANAPDAADAANRRTLEAELDTVRGAMRAAQQATDRAYYLAANEGTFERPVFIGDAIEALGKALREARASKRVMFCLWCAQKFDYNGRTLEEALPELEAHDQSCERNPTAKALREARAERDWFKAELNERNAESRWQCDPDGERLQLTAEVARLRARLESWERAVDEHMVVNWIGVYDSAEEPKTTLAKCITGAMCQEHQIEIARLRAENERVSLEDKRRLMGFIAEGANRCTSTHQGEKCPWLLLGYLIGDVPEEADESAALKATGGQP